MLYRVIVFIGLCGAALAQGRCDHACTSIFSCPQLSALLRSKRPEDVSLLRTSFCGDYVNNAPLVCCPEKSAPKPYQESFQGDSDEGVENHKNIRLLANPCGVIHTNKVVGGRKTQIYEFPWMVLLAYQTRWGQEFRCGGTLINSRYVLTAAHCIKEDTLYAVRVGEHVLNIEAPGEIPLQDIGIDEVIKHPGYTQMKNNDIALIRLTTNVDMTQKNAGAVCLPVTAALRTTDVAGREGWVSGWGITEDGSPSDTLLKVLLPVHSRAACRNYYNKYTPAGGEDRTLNKFCAGTYGKDSCGGDSGGPFMIEDRYGDTKRYVQYGIVSYGPKKCGSSFPGVYTDVSKYLKWILDNMKT